MDFTIKQYKQLLTSLQDAGFFFKTFSQYLEEHSTHSPEPALMRSRRAVIDNESPNKVAHISTPLNVAESKLAILRHDVDLLPENSLRFAQIQAKMGIKGSYYFRAVPESWDEDIIKEIAALGHEVGYHYETMDSASIVLKGQNGTLNLSNDRTLSLSKGNNNQYTKLIDLAYEQFVENLEKLRKLVPVSTICMHGSPRSKFDNKDIWKKYDYKSLGLIGEPYYDMDFDKFFYLTDTGRRWDGWKSSVRDKVPQQVEWEREGLVFHSTRDIIRALESGTSTGSVSGVPKAPEPVDSFTEFVVGSAKAPELRCIEHSRNVEGSVKHTTIKMPNQIMFTFHPQRWTDGGLPWLKELVLQNAKNFVKGFLVK